MRRLTTILCLTAIMLMLAAPAFAQTTRDPFDPAIEPAPEAATTTGDPADGTGTTTEGTTEERSTTQETAGLGEGLPNTGGATEPWIVAAYALIAIGCASAVGAKMLRTTS